MSTLNPRLEAAAPAPGNPPPCAMTEAEFLAWCDEEVRAEWVNGKVIVMSPTSLRHNRLADFLIAVMRPFVEKGKWGEVVGTEYSIRLAAQQQRRTPDLIFLSRERLDLLGPTHLEGPPDLAIEIVSPESVARDWREKYLAYEAAGVREYWVIDPMAQRAEAYTLGPDGTYLRIEEAEGRIGSLVLPGFFLRTAWLWQEPLPPVLDVLKDLGVI